MVINAPLPESLIPRATRLGMRPYYGDIHNHCDLSYGHGSLSDALAKAALQLDYVSITGHADWPDMPVGDASVAHIVDFHVKGFAKLRAGWDAHFEVLRTAESPGQFTVFPGYEIHSNEHGDYTIVLADLDPSPLCLADSPYDLKSALAEQFGDSAFGFPHHIGYRRGARGINWATFDSELSPFVEMYSMHGCAENSQTDRAYLHSMGPVDGDSTMEHGLREGHNFGIVGNTDHHSGFPGSYGHGRMAVYAKENERNALWSAMRARHTNALTGDRIHLLSEIDGSIQGDQIAPSYNSVLGIEAVAGGAIDTIDVIRNGALWHRISPAINPAPIEDGNEALLFLELGWGARGTQCDWVGELTLQNGEFHSVEPRFRGPEIVSPLEGENTNGTIPEISATPDLVRFRVTSEANPNNTTSTTQGVLMRVGLSTDAVICASLCGQSIEIPAKRLMDGSKSGNLGPIDSPAWRFHQLAHPTQWQWQGEIPLGTLDPGETIYLRLRQTSGQMAWSSPIFVRRD